MNKRWIGTLAFTLLLLVAFGVSAQDATPTGDAAAGDAPAIQVNDQVVINGMVMLSNVTSAGQGFVAIHVNLDGTPGPLVGIAPVHPGASQAIPVMIDTAGATPSLMAMLHVDDNNVGVFEHARVASADPPVMGPDGAQVGAMFNIHAVTAFPQQAVDDTVVIASAIMPTEGWVVIHADEGGQPGPVLGQAPIVPGTNTPVFVPVAAEGLTPTVFPMLHVDDNTVGTYEFGTVEGADAPVVIEGALAALPITLTEAPTVLTAAGVQVGDGATVPALLASDQALMGQEGAELAENSPVGMFTVDSATIPVQGWIDVHADGGGHPGKSLGMALLGAGENTGVLVALNPQMEPTPPFQITPVVWPMLHVDDANPGFYDYLMIPGADLAVVLNGQVVTLPVNVTGGELVAGEAMMGTDMQMGTPGAEGSGTGTDAGAGTGGTDAGTAGAEQTPAGGDAAGATATPAG